MPPFRSANLGVSPLSQTRKSIISNGPCPPPRPPALSPHREHLQATAILATLIGRNPAEARSRAEHLEALNLDFDTWLDER